MYKLHFDNFLINEHDDDGCGQRQLQLYRMPHDLMSSELLTYARCHTTDDKLRHKLDDLSRSSVEVLYSVTRQQQHGNICISAHNFCIRTTHIV